MRAHARSRASDRGAARPRNRSRRSGRAADVPTASPPRPELVWPGKYDSSTLADGKPLPTLEVVERIANGARDTSLADARTERAWHNLLVWGDNLSAMRALLPRFAKTVDLVYIDPPFGTGQDYAFRVRERTTAPEGVDASSPAYRDTWEAGIGSYLSAMLERLRVCRDLLADTGTIFVHCDWHVSHWMRCLLDEVFGANAFKNEVVWRYRRWPAKTRVFQRMHDVLFWYGKRADDTHTFHARYERLAASTLKTWGTKRQVADFSSGRRKPSQTDEESPGAPLSDVWDIGIIAPIARERCGYPTQKPEALLRRVIECTTSPGDLVMDVFCGSGTTLAVADKLGRRFIGCDVGRLAIETTKRRLRAAGVGPFDVLAVTGEISHG